jgi:hypothetical protein
VGQREKTCAVLSIISLLVALGAVAAAQTQITIGASTSGTIQFSGAGQTQVALVGSCGQTNCVQGYGYLAAQAGTYDMWITGNNPLVSATANPSVYAVNMNGGTLNFSFAIGQSSFTGTIQLTTLKDGTIAPQFLGSLTVLNSSGIFASLWSAGNVVPLDFTVTLPQGSALVDQVVAGTAGSTSGTLSSGEILAVTAPEPTSIALIGSGLLAVGGVLKRRMRK